MLLYKKKCTGIIDWTMQDIKKMNIRTQKIMTINGSLCPRSNVGMLQLKRYEGGRGLLSLEECVLAEMKSLNEYIRTDEELLLKKMRRENISFEEEMKEEYQKRMYDD